MTFHILKKIPPSYTLIGEQDYFVLMEADMKIHYFQRYHEKENVATANTMLLLSRLYRYSSDKFYQLLKSEFFGDSFEPELTFNLQEKCKESVPDASITQESFKIVVETKMSDWFYEDQLMRHLQSFSDEKCKILLTLAPEYMSSEKRAAFEMLLSEFNKTLPYPVRHINTTFEALTNGIRDVIDDRDYEMQDVLDDFLEYCYNDSLIPISDGWKYLRVQLAGTTFDFNIRENLYYDNIERGFRAHDYLGLYRNKSVKAIGKIQAIITATRNNDGELEFRTERGIITDSHKEAIVRAIEDGKQYGYDLNSERYFFVDRFYETDFRKITPRAPMGSRIFDLTQILKTEKLPSPDHLAKLLSEKTWG